MSITTIVTTTAQFLAALASAHVGDAIKLAPGTYSNVSINNTYVPQLQATPNAPTRILIESEYANNPAVLTDLNINNSVGLYLANLTFSTANTPVNPLGGDFSIPFQVYNSSQMTFTGITVTGSPTQTWATDASGMLIENSTHIGIRSSTFEYLHNGITQVGNNYVSFSSSSFSNLADDGIRGGGTSNITIDGNTFTSQHQNLADPDHPDAIQFWTSNTTTSASNITITNNVMTRGSGTPVEGVFLNDEVGNLPYKNVTIQGNSISGESYNGIVLDDAVSAVISGNTVTSYPDVNSAIKVLYSSKVSVVGNSAESFDYTSNTGLTTSSNTVTNPAPFPSSTSKSAFHSAALQTFGSEDTFTDPVPEPSAWAMMLFGTAYCGGLLRRRRTRAYRSA